MIEEKTTTKKVKETTYICDRCSKPITHIYASKKCSICNRDVCQKCAHWCELDLALREPYFISDNPQAVCRICWEKGEEIREKITISRKNQEEEERHLFQEWEELCK